MDRHLHPQGRAAQRGFTLLELAVTLAILGILVAITAVGVTGMRPKAQLHDAVAQISAIFATARDRAVADNAAVWVGFLPSTTPGGDNHVVVYRDWNLNFDPTTATTLATIKASAGNPADVETGACPGTCRHDELETVLDIPSRIQPIPETDFTSLGTMPDAYKWWGTSLASIPATPTTGCSFCNGSFAGNGWLEFMPNGQVRVAQSTGALQPKGAILTLGVTQNNAIGRGLVSITLPFGLSTEETQ